jgi:hypothetical protein
METAFKFYFIGLSVVLFAFCLWVVYRSYNPKAPKTAHPLFVQDDIDGDLLK